MTIKKHGYRTMPLISRTSDDVEDCPSLPNWMKEFANNLSKISVQPRKHEDSVFDQISSIVNSTKPKYSSVEAAVQDMQERSGLLEYQKKIKAAANSVKIAACDCENEEQDEPEIKIFKIRPQIQSTFDNYIEDTKGNLPIPAIIEKIKSIHKSDVSDDSAWSDDNLMQYVNEKCIEVKKMHPDDDISEVNLGKIPHYDDRDIDPSNKDALFSLQPTAVK